MPFRSVMHACIHLTDLHQTLINGLVTTGKLYIRVFIDK